jgi:hypothetical protein
MTDIRKDCITPHAVEAAKKSGGISEEDEKILCEELAVLDKIKKINNPTASGWGMLFS